MLIILLYAQHWAECLEFRQKLYSSFIFESFWLYIFWFTICNIFYLFSCLSLIIVKVVKYLLKCFTKIKRKCFEKYQTSVSVLEVNSLNIILLALLFCIKSLLLHLWNKIDSLDVVMEMFLLKQNSIFLFSIIYLYTFWWWSGCIVATQSH